MGLTLYVNTQWKDRKLTYKYQFHNLQNTKVMVAKDHGEIC